MKIKLLSVLAGLFACIVLRGVEDRIIIQQPQEFFIGLHDNQVFMTIRSGRCLPGTDRGAWS